MNVTLNEEGKKIWGDVFEKGTVPVKSFTFSNSNVGRIILVNWQLLSPWQKDAIVLKISKLSGQPEKDIISDIEKKGLPLRESLTTGTVVAEARFFI